ncbi:hypothetical protein Tco_0750259 [Tanacetum coccineum]|uniref:Gamma-glutamylcyclotransferase family protein n=1 Tax=Tanacetum coccineum TaxID=301880 RepID=A0ABQ4Z3Y2_9ASTR
MAYWLFGYGELTENVLPMVFDHSVIYGVSADVDTAYSSKSGNGHLARQVLDTSYRSRIIRRICCQISRFSQTLRLCSKMRAQVDDSINNGRGRMCLRYQDNRMSHFGGDNSDLRRDIVEGLIDLLDTHNGLVQLFRTGDMLGAIVYETGPEANMNYDIVLEERSWYPQHVNKLHSSYMSLQSPLIFIYGQDGYYKDLKMVDPTRSSSDQK